MRLVQLIRAGERRVGLINGEEVRLLDARRCRDIYSLAMEATESGQKLTWIAEDAVGDETLEYAPIYAGHSPWRLLPAFDHPQEPARLLVSGTGLTHKASADNRAAMHKAGAEITDSIRMYRMGLEGGNPAPGQIGIQPEWFFKGTGSILKAHNEELEVPPYARDGGEEPEIAGAYVITRDGEPVRVGLAVGNEFSDHVTEKKNYLYLAPSKLRSCSIGPELTIGEIEFEDVPGLVSVYRNDQLLWQKQIRTGQSNMAHSLQNLEHHHFKYEAHRRPGDAHVHFFGADAFSFGDGVELSPGDVMEVSFPKFGSPLRNRLAVREGPEEHVSVRVL